MVDGLDHVRIIVLLVLVGRGVLGGVVHTHTLTSLTYVLLSEPLYLCEIPGPRPGLRNIGTGSGAKRFALGQQQK